LRGRQPTTAGRNVHNGGAEPIG